MKDFFTVGSDGYVLLILIFVACVVGVLLMRQTKPRKKTRAEELQEQYATLTEMLLADTPEDQLVTAVVANLMGKLPRRRPDPLMTFPKLGLSRCAVYFVWLMMKEIEHNGVDALKGKDAARFNEMGIEGLKMVTATATADAVTAFLETDGHPDAVIAAIEKEQPLVRLAEYIRANPAEFTDE